MSSQRNLLKTIGNGDREEFRSVLDLLARENPVPSTEREENPSDADTVIVFQSDPDEYSREDVLELYLRHPFSRILCVYGPWCDADGRTRELWPLSLRVPVWRACQRLATERDGARLPWTATRDEIFGNQFTHRMERPQKRRLIRIDSPDHQFRMMLQQALEIEEPEESERGCVMLFDIDPWTERRRNEMLQKQSDSGVAGFLALIGFPEPTLIRELHSFGISTHWPKLSSLSELEQQIRSIS